MLLNVIDYPNVQAAIDAAEDGDRIYLPAGRYFAPSSGPWKLTKSLEIFGDGPSRSNSSSGTTLMGFGSADHSRIGSIFEITPAPGAAEVGPVYLHGLKCLGQDPTDPIPLLRGAFLLKCTLAAGQRIRSLRLDNMAVEAAFGPGYALDASPGTLESLSMVSCYATDITSDAGVTGSVGLGVSLKNVSLARLERGGGGGCPGGWLKAEASGVAMYVIECEHDGTDASAVQGEVLLLSCPIAHVDSCRYERFHDGTLATALELRGCGGAAMVLCNSFVKPDVVKASTGIKITTPAGSLDNSPVTIFSNNFIRIYGNGGPGAMIDATASHQGCVVLPQFDDGPSVIFPEHAGQINLPGFPNQGLVAAPEIRRTGQLTNTRAGLIIPSGSATPAVNVQNGMLYFAHSLDEEELYVRVSNSWRRVATDA